MSLLRTLLSPPGPWDGTSVPTPAERRAAWQLRRGEYLAAKELQRERVRLLLDQRAARRAKPLPAESVGTASPPLDATPRPRAARGTDTAATPFRYRFEATPEAELPDWHPDSLRYAGP